MICWRRPTRSTIGSLLEQQARLDLNYDSPGSTDQAAAPPGYRLDVNRVQLGEGEEVFEAACQAVRRWSMFDIGWGEVLALGSDGRSVVAPEPLEGQTVSALFRIPPVWWLTPCRVVYTIDEQASGRRFGFAYGTLPGHPMRGEEQFLVTLDDEGGCWYSITALSRPRHPLTRLGYPVARWMQRRFVRHSLQAMQRAVEQISS
jgi:uncharacterized protein (UPF0548 family)